MPEISEISMPPERAPVNHWLAPRLTPRFTLVAAGVAFLVATCVAIFWIDYPVAALTERLHGTWLRGVFAFLSRSGESQWYLIPAIIVMIVGYRRKPELARRALHLFAAVLLTGLAADLLKICIGRPRPKLYMSDHLSALHGFTTRADLLSMPSGHATTIGAVTCLAAMVFPRHRKLVIAIGVLAIACRVLAGYHFVSDVIVGGCLGALGTLLLARPCMAWRAGA